jgi:anti-sigma factor RsiW
MDHDASREQLELAALEPGGIDRLMAGDTATAQAVAAHLAGCPACSDELTRLTRASRLIAAVIAEAPPADLRERTLAGIRALGRPRRLESSAGMPLVAGVGVGSLLASPTSFPTTEPTATGTAAASRSGRRRVPGWVAAIAAAIVLSVATTSIVVGWRVDQRLAEQADTIGVLEEITTATLRVTAEAGARHVVLKSTSDPMLDGSLVFSPSTAELVVIATGLTAPPAGQEFRCWLERAGTRTSVGRMFFSDDIAYWIGPVPAVSGVSSDATFGVSLVDASGAPIGSSPILVGGL